MNRLTRNNSMEEWEFLREDMVEDQLRTRGVRDDRVLQAMSQVPRHLFIPKEFQERAYQDRSLPVGCGQTISQPYIVGVMLQALELTGDEKVLEIGTGTGYQAALLGYLAREVHTVETVPELAAEAERHLQALSLSNVHVHGGDGSLGWPAEAPYGAIVVSAAAPDVPSALLDQLVEGGRLVIPIGERDHQQLTLLQKKGTQIHRQILGGCVFVPLVGVHGWSPA